MMRNAQLLIRPINGNSLLKAFRRNTPLQDILPGEEKES